VLMPISPAFLAFFAHILSASISFTPLLSVVMTSANLFLSFICLFERELSLKWTNRSIQKSSVFSNVSLKSSGYSIERLFFMLVKAQNIPNWDRIVENKSRFT